MSPIGFLRVSYMHFIQTLAVTLTVWEIIALKVGFFDPPLSLMIEKSRQFWTVADKFSERCNIPDVTAVKIFPKRFTVSSQRAKTWRQGRKNDRFLDVFWPLWPGFWTFQKSPSSVLITCKKARSCQAQIGRDTAEKSCPEEKKANGQKNIILPKFWKIAFLQKRQYKKLTASFVRFSACYIRIQSRKHVILLIFFQSEKEVQLWSYITPRLWFKS